jgi:hypothetical protein
MFRIIYILFLCGFITASCEECTYTQLRDLRNSYSSDWQKLEMNEVIKFFLQKNPSFQFYPSTQKLESISDQTVFDFIQKQQFRSPYKKLNFDSFTYLLETNSFYGYREFYDVYINHKHKEVHFYHRSQIINCYSPSDESNRGYDYQGIWELPKIPIDYAIIYKTE